MLALVADIVMRRRCRRRTGDAQGRGDHRDPPGRGQSRDPAPCEALMALLYGADASLRPAAKGTIESVEAIDGGAAPRPATAERFAPGELTLVVVGDVDAARAIDAAARRVRRMARGRRRGRSTFRAPARAAARRRLVVPMMNKAQADIAYGFIVHQPRRSGLLRVLADEQRARAVRARRPARRQHPRAAGHGLLRLEHRSTRTSSPVR